jgi:hypothetical protein
MNAIIIKITCSQNFPFYSKCCCIAYWLLDLASVFLVLTPITEEDYERHYWPQLDGAVKHLLTTKPSEYIPISYEQMYT